MNQADISKIEHAEANPTLDTLAALATPLGVTLGLEPVSEATRALMVRRPPGCATDRSVDGIPAGLTSEPITDTPDVGDVTYAVTVTDSLGLQSNTAQITVVVLSCGGGTTGGGPPPPGATPELHSLVPVRWWTELAGAVHAAVCIPSTLTEAAADYD